MFTLASMRKRITAIFFVVIFLFCALSVRLFVIQIINGKSLQQKATSQWTRDLSLTALRGTIYDANGNILAYSYTTYNIYVRAREILDAKSVALSFAQLFGTDYITAYQKVTQKNLSEVLIKQQVSAEIAQKVYNWHYDGVYLSENVARNYPYQSLLSQVLGFCNVEGLGQSGVEAYYNNILAGEDGYSYVQADLVGKEIGGSLRYYVYGKKGQDLVLTIDVNMQKILEEVLAEVQTTFSAKSATGMIVDTTSGQLKAIAALPSFNLNFPPRDDLETLFSQSKIKAVCDSYEPGSTFKIFTVAMALEENLTSLNDTFYCPGYRIVDGQKIKCWKTTGHGTQTLAEAFANSCNCCFMDLAQRIGVDKFYEYLQKFGFGQKTGIDISGESSGILMTKSSVKKVDLARMGFGHAVAVTPIQLVRAVTALTSYQGLSDISVVQKSQTKSGALISANTTKILNQLLQGATNKKGDCTFVEGYNVGGKTGDLNSYVALNNKKGKGDSIANSFLFKNSLIFLQYFDKTRSFFSDFLVKTRSFFCN